MNQINHATSNYVESILSRRRFAGFTPVPYGAVSTKLFPFQAALVRWALGRGRAALFADTGLGKTAMQMEWARHVSSSVGRVLVVAPLAVGRQSCRESRGVLGWDEPVYRQRDEGDLVTVTNYERLDNFDPAGFAGVVLDESSILKSFTGAFRNLLISRFADVPHRLACTATPAPNDHTELGNHSEFLGVKSRSEMLSEYFVNDFKQANTWRLKGHAVGAFWHWVASWGMFCGKPSDIGFSDDGYDLPELTVRNRMIEIDEAALSFAGMLFAPSATTLSEQRDLRRGTLAARVRAAVDETANADAAVVWCEYNAESDAVAAAIPDAVAVSGSDSPERKEELLAGFADGVHRVLVTKPSIAGFGLNWQHCAKMVFMGPSHSYEKTYQCIRRSWRFGQSRPVDVVVLTADQERAIVDNYTSKELAAGRLQSGCIEAARASLGTHHTGAAILGRAYEPQVEIRKPRWNKD